MSHTTTISNLNWVKVWGTRVLLLVWERQPLVPDIHRRVQFWQMGILRPFVKEWGTNNMSSFKTLSSLQGRSTLRGPLGPSRTLSRRRTRTSPLFSIPSPLTQEVYHGVSGDPQDSMEESPVWPFRSLNSDSNRHNRVGTKPDKVGTKHRRSVFNSKERLLLDFLLKIPKNFQIFGETIPSHKVSGNQETRREVTF